MEDYFDNSISFHQINFIQTMLPILHLNDLAISLHYWTSIIIFLIHRHKHRKTHHQSLRI